MTDYVRIHLASIAVEGDPGPLPAALVGLDDGSLADLPAAIKPVPAAFKGTGYWPVDYQPAPPFDPRAKTVDGHDLDIDPDAKRVEATPIVRNLTAEEVAALPPLPVPNVISDRQFTEILAMDGLITEDEALAWAGPGTVPAQLLDAVEQIPDDAVRFSAKMHLVGATQFLRDNVFVQMLGMILDRDATQLDDIWTRAAAL